MESETYQEKLQRTVDACTRRSKELKQARPKIQLRTAPVERKVAPKKKKGFIKTFKFDIAGETIEVRGFVGSGKPPSLYKKIMAKIGPKKV
jgi:hypothetical protein